MSNFACDRMFVQCITRNHMKRLVQPSLCHHYSLKPTLPDKIVDTSPLPPHSMLVNAQFRSKFVSWPLDCRTNIEPGGGGGVRKESFWDRLGVVRCVWLMIFRKMDKINPCVNTFCPGLYKWLFVFFSSWINSDEAVCFINLEESLA